MDSSTTIGNSILAKTLCKALCNLLCGKLCLLRPFLATSGMLLSCSKAETTHLRGRKANKCLSSSTQILIRLLLSNCRNKCGQMRLQQFCNSLFSKSCNNRRCRRNFNSNNRSNDNVLRTLSILVDAVEVHHVEAALRAGVAPPRNELSSSDCWPLVAVVSDSSEAAVDECTCTATLSPQLYSSSFGKWHD